MTSNDTRETSTRSDDLREIGMSTMCSIVPGMTDMSSGDMRDGLIGEELVEIGLVNVWAELWAREGLSRRSRSLVTLGVLIGLGAEDEFGSHVRIGMSNGLTEDEIAEVIYHASGYAGFPRAMAARKAARRVLYGE